MELIDQHIEALIFAAEHNVTDKEIKATLDSTMDESVKNKDIQASLDRLKSKFDQEEFSFELVKINNGYTFMTKSMYHDTIGNHLKKINKKKLSKAALETLAMIAYKQPVTKVEVESIRGVNCDYVVQKLLEKELVEIAGRSDAPGRPLIYKTSAKFMDYFGISDVSDLPKPKDFALPETEIGEPAPIEEDITTTTQNEEANPGPAIEVKSVDSKLTNVEEKDQEADHTAVDHVNEGQVDKITVQPPVQPIEEEHVETITNEPIVDNIAVDDVDDTKFQEPADLTESMSNDEAAALLSNDDTPDQQISTIIDESVDDDIDSDLGDEEENRDAVDQNEIKDVTTYIEAEKAKLSESDGKPFTIYASESEENESHPAEHTNKEEE